MNDKQIEILKASILSTLSRTDNVGTIAVTTALVRLFARQTEAERQAGGTSESNGRGFNYYDGKYEYGSDKSATYMAAYCLGSDAKNRNGVISPTKWDEEVAKLKAGRRTPIRLLSGRFLASARRMTKFYIRQLVEEAVAKADAKEQAERIAAQSACDNYFGHDVEKCPSTVKSPRFPYQSAERPINVSVV